MPMKIRATGHRIPVSTIEAALPFYEGLGFKSVFQAEEWGWATLEFGEFTLASMCPERVAAWVNQARDWAFFFGWMI